MANFYYVGADGSYPDLAANWSATSGGAGGAGVPNDTADLAIFDGSSGSPTLRYTLSLFSVNLADFPSAKTINTGSANFWIRSAFVGNANSPFTSTTGTVRFGYLTNTGAWTLAGITINSKVEFTGTGAKTVSGAMTIVGLLTIPASSNQTISGSGSSVTCQGGVSFGSVISGTTTFHFAGGTVQTTSATVGACSSPKTITAGAGTVTFGTHFRSSGNLTYVSGTVVTTNNTFYSINAGLITTVNGANSMEFNNFIQTNTAFTMGSDITINGLFTFGSNDQTLGHATRKIYAKGGVTAAAAYITFTGAGLWIQGGNISSVSGHILGNVTFDGNSTFTSKVPFRSGTLSYNSGDVTTTGQIVEVNGTVNMAVGNNIVWDLLLVSNRANSLTSILNVTDDMECGTLFLSPANMISGAAVTLNISNGKKVKTDKFYTAENEFTTATVTSAGIGLLEITGTYADKKIYGTVFENIDASSSDTRVLTWQGTVTNCVNVFAVDGQDIGGAGVSVTHY